MNPLFSAFAAAAVLATISSPAQARRGASETQELLFVASTDIVEDGQQLALCQLVTTTSKFGINFWRSVEEYALAPNNCQSTSAYSISPEEITLGRDQGIFPSDLPDEPKLSMSDMAKGMWGIGLGIGLLGFFGISSLKTSKRRKERHELMGDASPQAIAILDAMCHAAKADGDIAQEEIADIVRVARELTGQSFDPATVRRMIELAEDDADQDACKRLIKPVAPGQHSNVMRAVLSVVAADGSMSGGEQKFVGALMAAMKMPAEEVNAMLGEIASGTTPAE